MINARSESAFEKPAFREAMRLRRCLVPADGFFEWRSTGGARVPFFVRMKDARPFAMAAIWERWEPREGPPLESCAVLTTPANELVARLHDRMPAIIGPGDFDLWLDPGVRDAERILPLLRPFPAREMVAARRKGAPAECIARISPTAPRTASACRTPGTHSDRASACPRRRTPADRSCRI